MTFDFIFFGIWFFIFGIIFIVYCNSKNKKSELLFDEYSNFADKYAKKVWKDIIINCRDEFKIRMRVRMDNKCDIYVYDNYFVVVARKSFFYNSVPVFITFDVEQTRKITGFSNVYKPSKISFLQKKNKKITFEIKDIIYKEFLLLYNSENTKYYKSIISFKNLTEEQIDYFEQIKDWCN